MPTPIDWGGPLKCLSNGTSGPWVMRDPERLLGKSHGSGQCVAIAQIPLKMPLVKHWRQGETVLGGTVAKGTVIATFVNGRYPNDAHDNHVAIFLEEKSDDQGTYIVVIDQWTGRKAAYRKIRPKSGDDDRSNDADCFSTVYTLNGK
ncbi:hypothetical protein rosag_43770 [Roseisolibacter agri]|uniref:BPSL0067 family protein n=2 Tax=Roseisolibacter agri TaxID=2014610 RepID=A0AA37Q7U7_9BACT|nr:hypothetical protein rosag_43770 [Roseisolibacter agri]